MNEITYRDDFKLIFGTEITILDKHNQAEIPFDIFDEMYEAWNNEESAFFHNSYSFEYLRGPALIHIETPDAIIDVPAVVWTKMLSDYMRYM